MFLLKIFKILVKIASGMHSVKIVRQADFAEAVNDNAIIFIEENEKTYVDARIILKQCSK